jgi:hypothetical protein
MSENPFNKMKLTYYRQNAEIYKTNRDTKSD